MEITVSYYARTRKQWRTWLEKNHLNKSEIWLIYYKKHSGKPRVPYADAVEEALCFGWIDSTVKGIDADSYAQRFTPRRKNSFLSELNRQRILRLIKEGKMTAHGLAGIRHHLNRHHNKETGMKHPRKYKMPADILTTLKANKEAWKNFRKFPEHYKHIRIAWIDAARRRPDIFRTRLNYFIRMTEKNKKYGSMR